MKIICAKNELLGALRFVSKAVAVKPQTPLLSAIYLKAEGDTVELQGNNNEIGFTYSIKADIETPGHIALTGRYFQEIVTKLPGEEVTLAYDRENKLVRITSGSADFHLLSMDANAYPTVQQFEGNLQFTIKDNVLRDLIRKTTFACSTDQSRPLFTGCSVQVDHSHLLFAATNTHRLAVNTYVLPEDAAGSILMIVPARILLELKQALSSEIPIDVQVTCSYNSISFRFENIFMTSRLLEGMFPDFKRVIPPDFITKVHLNTELFRAAVERVSLIARSSEYNIIKLAFDAEADSVLISSTNQEVGGAEEKVPCRMEGPSITIAFNALYIGDALKNFDSEDMTFCLNQPLTAARLIEDGRDEFTYVVTPVRTAH